MTSLELRSKITSDGVLTLSIEEVDVPEPSADEVIVRVEAAPLNPSDIGLLVGTADLSTLSAGGTRERPTLTAKVPNPRTVKARLDQSMVVGNEGAGEVVAAGANARHLVGRRVATWGNGMYAQARKVHAAGCLVLPEGVTAKQGASALVNPLTVLGMLETMRREGHTALVHTAAASNVGQMLVRICAVDGIPLVNIVRKPEQVALLRGLGAEHVVDSSSPGFGDELRAALEQTGATLAFDAIGGGTIAATILGKMEEVAVDKLAAYSRYGSPVHKQVYIYGGLDPAPKVIEGNLGLAWGIGGWLISWFLEKAGGDVRQRMMARIAAELTTTFASTYGHEISLSQALDKDTLLAYAKRATGEKYLVVP
jgi:NADPH2:quinone reductase